AAAFPAVRRRGPLALIILSTAVPTLPLMATGTLGRDQLAAFEQVLAKLAAEDVFRVLLVHHPLKSKARQKRMTDSADLLALIKSGWLSRLAPRNDDVSRVPQDRKHGDAEQRNGAEEEAEHERPEARPARRLRYRRFRLGGDHHGVLALDHAARDIVGNGLDD